MSSEPSGSGELSKYPDILTWLGAHSDLSQYLSFSVCTGVLQTIQFMRKRKAIHNRSITDLGNFLSSVEKEYKVEKKKVEELCAQVFTSPITYYSNKHENFIVRKLSFIDMCIHKKQVYVHNIMFTFLQELIVNIKRLLWVFSSRIIPDDQIAILSPSFLRILYPSSISGKLIKIQRLESYKKSLEEAVQQFPIPVYITNFSDFFISILKSIEPIIDPDLSYFPQTEAEVEISRAFFYYNSPRKHFIDSNLRKISQSNPEEFTKVIHQLCYDVMPDRTKLTSLQQSIALLVLFRTIFHRFYEKYSSFFYKKADSDESKIQVLSNSAALRYTLPVHLLSIESISELHNNPNMTIRNLFSMDENFQKAAHFMEDAFFMSNPIDCLYCIQQSLLVIHNGAISNRNSQKLLKNSNIHLISENNLSDNNNSDNNHSENNNSDNHNSEINNSDNNNSDHSQTNENSQDNETEMNRINLAKKLNEEPNDDEGYLLCFDDLFSLFFGTFMASDLPDLFSMVSFVQNYTPKQCLSPSFDYAQADLEALVVHCRTLDPISLTVPKKGKGSFV